MRRFLKISAGFALIAVGLVMALPGVPGPGLLIAAGGLALLAEHFHWARRIMDWGKTRLKAAQARAKRRGSTAEAPPDRFVPPAT